MHCNFKLINSKLTVKCSTVKLLLLTDRPLCMKQQHSQVIHEYQAKSHVNMNIKAKLHVKILGDICLCL